MSMKKWLALVMIATMMVCMLPAAPLGILADDITYGTVYDVNFLDETYAAYTSEDLNALVNTGGIFKAGPYNDQTALASLRISGSGNGLQSDSWTTFAQLFSTIDLSNFRLTTTINPSAWQWYNIGVRVDRNAEGANMIPNYAVAEDETATEGRVDTPIIGQGTDGGIFFSLQATWPHAESQLAVGIKGNALNSTQVFYIPNPTEGTDWATQIQNGAAVVVVDHENEVSLSVGGTTVVKVVLDKASLADGVYTAGEVFDADGASLGTFTNKYVLAKGMVGLFVRANDMNLKALKLELEQVAEGVNKDELQAAVDKAVTTYIAAYYTADSVAAYEAALANAKTVLIDPAATQLDVEAALTQLNNAALVASDDTVGKIETIQANESVVELTAPSEFETTPHDAQSSDGTAAKLQWDEATQQKGDGGMELKFQADKAGYKDLTISYDFAHPTGQPVYMLVTTNGDSENAIITTFNNNANGVWGRYQESTIKIPVVAGENTVRISSYQETASWQIYVNYVILGATSTDSGALAAALAKLPAEQGDLDADTWNVYQSVKAKAEAAATSDNAAAAEDAIASIEAALAGDFVGEILPNMPMTSVLEPTKVVEGSVERWNDYDYAWFVVADEDDTTSSPMKNGIVVKFYSAAAGEKEVTFMANGADPIGDNMHRVSFVMNEGETNSATKADASVTFEKSSWDDKYELTVTVPVKAGLNVMRIANDNITRPDCRIAIPYIVLGETKPATEVQYSELFKGDGTVFEETFTDDFERTDLGVAWGGVDTSGPLTITNGKLPTSGFASVNTNAVYEKAIYTFKYQVTTAGNRKGFAVRVNGHGGLYGNYSESAQGLLFDIIGGDENDLATYANHFVIVPIEDNTSTASKYKIPYPAGFNQTAEHTYTVADYGTYVTYTVDGVPTAIVQLTDYDATTNTYGGGVVLNAQGEQIGEPFVASIPASGSLVFASRIGSILVDDVSISTPVVIEVVDTAKLQAAVDAAKALNLEDYTAVTWDNVPAAIAAAEAVLAKAEPTEDEIAAALNNLNAATAALVSKLFEGDRTRFAEVFSDDFSKDTFGTNWAYFSHNSTGGIDGGKLVTGGIAAANTIATYGKASYEFKAAATAEVYHAGFGLRALNDGDLYGDYSADYGQGILFDIVPQTQVGGSGAYLNSFVVTILGMDTDNATTVNTAFATANKYAIPYPADFDPTEEHDYKVVDYGSYITITIDGVPTAIVTLGGHISDPTVAEGGYYTRGAVLNAAGVELGSFYANIPASGSLVFAARLGSIIADDVKIGTPADPLEPEYKVTFTPNGNSMWTATVAITGGVFTNGSISIDYDAAKTVLMKADGTAAASDADAFADIVSAASGYGVYIENTDNTNQYNWIDTTDGHIFLNWQANGPKIDATEGYVNVATLIFKVDAPENVTPADFAVVEVAEGDYENWTAGAELVDEYLDLYAYGSEGYPLLVTFDFPEVHGAFIAVEGGVASATSAAEGTEVTLTPQPAPGYEFVSWEVVAGDITITDNKFIMPAEDVSVKAIFQKITYTITVEGGSYTGTPQIDETITLTPDAAEAGYEFTGWEVVSGGVTITDNTFTMPAGDVSVKAIFEKERLTITLTNATYEGEPIVGELITLKAEVPEGKVLLGWNVITPADLQIIKNVFIMPGVDVEIEPIFGEEDTNYTVSGTVEYMSKGKDTVTITFTHQYYSDRVTVVETDANGEFSVELAAGVYRVVFETAGHLTTTYVSYAVDGDNTLDEELYTGDANGDDAVTNVDLAYVVLAVNGYNAIADINQDGVADIDDLIAVSVNLGKKAVSK